MPKFPGFATGPSNRQRSRNVDASEAINRFFEVVGTGTPKAPIANYRRPGLRVFASCGTGPVRGLFSQDGRTFAVSANVLYEVLSSGNVVSLGPVIYNSNPATMCSSGQAGHQLFVVSGGEGYIFDTDTDTFTNVTSPTFPNHAVSGMYFDTYFLALSGADGRFQLSGQLDGFTWNALDFGLEAQFSDQVVQFLRVHDNLWLFGSRNTGPWYDSGNASFPFAPIQGSIIEHGIAAPFSAVEMDNAPWWLVRDAQGSGMVVRADGYTPVRVSTSAVEYDLNRLNTYEQSIAWAYQEQGHSFYVLYVPGLDLTWVYDASSQRWAKWGHWVPRLGRWIPYVGTQHCFAFGKHLVGDRQSGAIYHQSLDYPDDDLVIN